MSIEPTSSQFNGIAKELVETATQQEYHKFHYEYVVFRSVEEKERAKKLIDEYRQEDSRLVYFDSYGDDKNPNCLEIKFTKTTQNQWGEILEFFNEKGIHLDQGNIHTVDPMSNEIHH